MKDTLMLILLFIVILLLLCFTSGNLSAQSINRDSLIHDSVGRDSIVHDSIMNVPRIIEAAKMDGRRLRLSAIQREKFIADKKNSNSDLFKPRIGIVSDATLINDSVYVKAFRATAYKKAYRYRKRTTGHYVLVGGIIAVSAVAAFFVIGISIWVANGAHVGV
jgi:hypothetical protein